MCAIVRMVLNIFYLHVSESISKFTVPRKLVSTSEYIDVFIEAAVVSKVRHILSTKIDCGRRLLVEYP